MCHTDMPASEEVTDNSCGEDILQMLGNLSLRRLCEPQIATKVCVLLFIPHVCLFSHYLCKYHEYVHVAACKQEVLLLF